MMEDYRINYSAEAMTDLLEIYHYIADKLLVPRIAEKQIARIRKAVRALCVLPGRHSLVSWEPWHSIGMHQVPVDHFIVFYIVDDKRMIVSVVRIFYSGRNIESIINEEMT